ncbi:hypothetical protein ARGLB_048_00080 [Arthrobacter globiformis NBRC 12137]|uniref:Uncharacterized protein n=1 Tax=Arthrobacter globiformis (strain ATCC 8010 / DSM 20124 / JCM 1332 / NBRC 12137 / NCIMB 8907 / NRRL B-2979 / 168) TaxID=1077972 RepID=H0QLT3_ARTG1|nr:hypothetical protein ARGLB_048_00080 [Arthrobacter globiformis NBRC 12137]
MAEGNTVQAAVEKAREEMLFIGPDHPYYRLLAELVTAVETAWQQGYDAHRTGRHNPTPIAGTWEPNTDSPPHGSPAPGGRIAVTVTRATGATGDFVITFTETGRTVARRLVAVSTVRLRRPHNDG